MVKAMAAHKDFADKIDLQVQVAGPNAQRQIQQINAMVQAGAKAIVVYPISPTALNAVVKNACSKGVIIIAYDAAIEEPCAYNVDDRPGRGRPRHRRMAGEEAERQGQHHRHHRRAGHLRRYPAHQGRRRKSSPRTRASRSSPKRSACGARQSPAPSSPRSSPPITGTRSTGSGPRSAATPQTHAARSRQEAGRAAALRR